MSRKNRSFNLKQRQDAKYRHIIDNLKAVGIYDEITGETYTAEKLLKNKEKLDLIKKKFA